MITSSYGIIDGSRVRLSSSEALRPLTEPTSVVTVETGARKLEVIGGVRSFGREVAQAAARVDLTESYRLHNGDLLIGSGRKDEYNEAAFVGVWEGIESSIYAYTRAFSKSELIAVLGEGRIEESDEGVVWDVSVATSIKIADPPYLLRSFEQLGIVSIWQMTDAWYRSMPKWSGTSVAGGELFVERMPETPAGPGQDMLALYTESAVARILPRPEADEAQVLDLVEGLSLSWIDRAAA